MRGLRTIRIVLATVFLVASVAYLTVSPWGSYLAGFSVRSQIIPSAIATTMGVTLFWILASFILGRVYCSTVCPVGTLQDVFIRLRRRIPRFDTPFSYRPATRVRYHVLAIYLVCLIVGVLAVPYWIEPWNIMRNICSTVNPDAVQATWIQLGLGALSGIIAGVISLILLVVCSLFTGRGFCTEICPIGTVLGCFHNYTLFHIEIDPDKCINCMKCEEVCKSQCVKVVGRYVDNSRCVRCFDCLGVCPNEAIRFQVNRNRRGTPLVRKVGRDAAK